ncbi:MAG: dTMP kinase [Sandaracinaceae bacterium]
MTPGRRARGRLVAVEGLDGSGKTAFSRALADELGARWTTTPDATLRLVRDAVDDTWRSSPRARRLFYAASVLACSDLCGPHLDAGETIVVDRYWASTVAYGELDDTADLLEPLGPLVRPADATFYLELSEPIRRARLLGRGATRLDRASLEHHRALRESYRRALSAPAAGRVFMLDAGQPLTALVAHAAELLARGPLGGAQTEFALSEQP